MSGKHARREPGLSTAELELRFPAHRRPDDNVIDELEAGARALESETSPREE